MMKSARIITKTHTKAKLSVNGKSISLPVVKRRALNTSRKITAHSQFMKIKEALAEVELIEAGKIKPASLKEALNEL